MPKRKEYYCVSEHQFVVPSAFNCNGKCACMHCFVKECTLDSRGTCRAGDKNDDCFGSDCTECINATIFQSPKQR